MPYQIDESYTLDHRRLMRVAAVANVAAWVALFINILIGLSTVLSASYQQNLQDYTRMLPEALGVRFLNLAASVTGRLLSGIVAWLLLKGVALALNMLVETDCNYRSRVSGENHE